MFLSLQKGPSLKEAIASNLHETIVKDLEHLLSNVNLEQFSVSEALAQVMDANSPSLLNETPIVSRKVCQVQFRHVFRYYKLPVQITDIQVGEFVIVQSFVDKSHEDLGIVTKVFPLEEFEDLRARDPNNDDIDETKLGKILRIAVSDELKYLPMKYQRELPLLRICQNYSMRHQMPMTITGVDFQLDGNVLFVYYIAKERVDYRPLVKFIIKMYLPNCRIQMKNTEGYRPFKPFRFAQEALITGQKTTTDTQNLTS